MRAGDQVPVGTKITHSYSPSKDTQTECSFTLYKTRGKNPAHVTDAGCKRESYIKVVCGTKEQKKHEKSVDLTLEFGGTEVKATARGEATGDEKSISFTFV